MSSQPYEPQPVHAVPPPPPAPGVLIGVTVSGLSSMNEGGTGTYTATGTWDNGSTGAVTPTWSVSNAYATISSGGLLTASAVTSNQTVTVTASYGGKTGTMNVTIINASAVLTGIAVSGPTSVNATFRPELSGPAYSAWRSVPSAATKRPAGV